MENKTENKKETYEPNPENEEFASNVKGSFSMPEKESTLKRVVKLFLPDDVKDIKKYIVREVVVPNTKKAVLATVKYVLYGTINSHNDNSNYNSYYSGGSYNNYNNVSYRNYNDRYSAYNDREVSRRNNEINYLNFGDIQFPSKAAALMALDRMVDIIKRHGRVTVLEFCEFSIPREDIAARSQIKFTWDGFGWTNIEGTQAIYNSRTGMWILDLPRAREL